MKEKRCFDCGKVKLIEEFPFLWKKKSDLRRAYCKKCNVIRAMTWAKKHRDKVNANSKVSYYKKYFPNKYRRKDIILTSK